MKLLTGRCYLDWSQVNGGVAKVGEDLGTNSTAVRNRLIAGGFANIGTATFEADNAVQNILVQTLHQVIDRLSNAVGGSLDGSLVGLCGSP